VSDPAARPPLISVDWAAVLLALALAVLVKSGVLPQIPW
jgi:hypothetical protein